MVMVSQYETHLRTCAKMPITCPGCNQIQDTQHALQDHLSVFCPSKPDSFAVFARTETNKLYTLYVTSKEKVKMVKHSVSLKTQVPSNRVALFYSENGGFRELLDHFQVGQIGLRRHQTIDIRLRLGGKEEDTASSSSRGPLQGMTSSRATSQNMRRHRRF
jgi:hypothetical protein